MCVLKLGAFKWILALSVALTVGACTKKEIAPPADRPPVETEINVPKAEARTTDLLQVNHYQDLLDAEAPSWTKSFDTIYSEVLKPLSSALLSVETLGNREFTASTEFQSYLEVMHKAYLQLNRLNSQSPKLKAALENYETVALKPCLEKRDACRALKLVGRDRSYVFVIEALINALKPDPTTAWNYLLHSLDFSQFPKSKEFADFSLNAGEKYLAVLSRKDPSSISKEVADFLRLFNQIVQVAEPSAVTRFFDRIDIWAVQQNEQLVPTADADPDPKISLRPTLRKALWPILVTNHSIVDGQATASFQKLIDSHLADFDTEVMKPFRDDPSWKRVAQSYSLKTDLADFDRRYLALLNMTFMETLSPSDVLPLLRSLRVSQDTLLKVTDDYVQLRFAWMTMTTQKELAPLMGTAKDYASVKELLQNLLRAIPLEEKWARYQDKQMASLQLVIESYVAGLSVDPETSRIQKLFIRRDENIKRSVIYPNMLPVVYYVALGNMRDSLRYLWFSVTVDSDLIFEYLFDGRLSSWFNFTNAVRDRYIYGSEVVEAFNNAILTELFPAYGIKPSDFLLQTINRLTTKTVAALVTSSSNITFGIMADYEDRGSMRHRSHFIKITDTCQGKANYQELIELKDLGKTLHGHIADLLGNPVRMGTPATPPYWFQLTPSGRPGDNISNLSDSLRTRELIFLDQIDEMVAMYKRYTSTYGLTDEVENFAKIDAEVLKLRSAYRHYFGLVFQAMDRYDSCAMKVTKEQLKRQKQVMAYEEVYLKGVYADLRAAHQNPSQVPQLNSRYARTFPEMAGYQAADRIEQVGSSYYFFYNQPDFLLRARDYLKSGTTARDGVTYPPIAPHVQVTYPGNPLSDVLFRDSYRMFYQNDRFTTLIYQPGMTEEDFIKQGFSQAFWTPSDNLEHMESDVNRLKFGSWSESANSPRILPIYRARLANMAIYIKSGPVEVYDFEKPGCGYTDTYEKLNENCVRTREVKIDEMVQAQDEIFDLVKISAEDETLLKKINSATMWPRKYLTNIFISELDQAPMGILDPIRFLLSSDSLGSNVNYPGSDQRNREGILVRPGYLKYAEEYYRSATALGEPLLQPQAGLKTDLKALYQTYVDREFDPLIELNELVTTLNEAGASRTLYYSTFAEPKIIPVVTGYSSEPTPLIQRFHNETSNFFTK